jgi:hypothetical protein
LVMPDPGEKPASIAGAVRMVVAAYHSQNPGLTRYRVLESRPGTHIVPDQARDETGRLVPAISLLDTRLTVPIERRTATAHVIALCEAVSKAGGRKLVFGETYFDMEFAANGYLIPNLASGWTEQAKPYISFDWGADENTARDALIDLLDRSSTTMTWRLYCMPNVSPKNETCFLQIRPLTVGPDQVVRLDRCIIDPTDTLAVQFARVAKAF